MLLTHAAEVALLNLQSLSAPTLAQARNQLQHRSCIDLQLYKKHQTKSIQFDASSTTSTHGTSTSSSTSPRHRLRPDRLRHPSLSLDQSIASRSVRSSNPRNSNNRSLRIFSKFEELDSDDDQEAYSESDESEDDDTFDLKTELQAVMNIIHQPKSVPQDQMSRRNGKGA